MLTRLQVKGFKNLADVDVSFGPFTCIAGPNGVGKSNLFDAITFLSETADKTLLEAAFSVRAESARAGGDARSIFRHVSEAWGDEVCFEVDMLIPPEGRDDLGQRASATSTFLRYSLTVAREDEESSGASTLRIRREELFQIKQADAVKLLQFGSESWQKSVVRGKRSTAFISTTPRPSSGALIRLHSEGGKKNRPKEYAAIDLPRTVLSSVNAVESPTALLARREMQSWRLLQLEPSALRAPDSFTAPSRIARNGAHLPATLARLAGVHRKRSTTQADAQIIYQTIANRLAELVENVRAIRVDADERRELLSIAVKDRSGTDHDARALSDGTLRFLALAILANDPEAVGVLCLEEPENGIHPDRVPAMLRLLHDLAVDSNSPIGRDNPLRQVIVNTHSPSVVQLCNENDLVLVTAEPTIENGKRVQVAMFRWLSRTWRVRVSPSVNPVPPADLLGYLNTTPSREDQDEDHESGESRLIRVVDRSDLQLLLPLSPHAVHE